MLNYIDMECFFILGLWEEIQVYIDWDIESFMQLVVDWQFFICCKKGEKQFKLYIFIDGKEFLFFDLEVIDFFGKLLFLGCSFIEDGSWVVVGM